jgi:hypothetical protein
MGLLSQALQNLDICSNQISCISNLPLEAAAVQSAIAQLLTKVKAPILAYQQRTLSVVSDIAAKLAHILGGAIDSSKAMEIAAIINSLEKVQDDTRILRSSVDDFKSQMQTQASQLSTIEIGLNAQIAGLQGQLSSQRQELASAQKRYYWLIALGPFGLAGLSVALALVTKWKNEASKTQNSISNMTGQIVAHKNMASACNTLLLSGTGIWNVVSDVENALDIIISNFQSIKTDVEAGNKFDELKLFFTVAAHELQELQNDIS